MPKSDAAEKNGKSKGGKYVLFPDTLKVAKFASADEAGTIHETDPNAIVLRKKDVKKLRKRLKKKL
jgi:hypothetical protein